MALLCIAAKPTDVCQIFQKVTVSGRAVTVTQTPLAQIPPEKHFQVKLEIIELARRLYDAGRAEGKDTLFPIDPAFYDDVLKADRATGLSQVQLDEAGHVVGFILGHRYTQDGSVHLEKIGVDPNLQKQGMMTDMLRETAARAKALGAPYVDLLVVKTNTVAHAAYEKVGFKNVTPPQYRNDPRYNAFAFAVPTDTLVEKTRATTP